MRPRPPQRPPRQWSELPRPPSYLPSCSPVTSLGCRASPRCLCSCSGKYHVTEKVSGLFSGLGKKASSLDTKYNISGEVCLGHPSQLIGQHGVRGQHNYEGRSMGVPRVFGASVPRVFGAVRFGFLGHPSCAIPLTAPRAGKAGGAVGAALDGVAGAAGTVTAAAAGAGSHPAGSGAAPGKQPGGATGPTAI